MCVAVAVLLSSARPAAAQSAGASWTGVWSAGDDADLLLEVLAARDGKMFFQLTTSLTTVCRALGVPGVLTCEPVLGESASCSRRVRVAPVAGLLNVELLGEGFTAPACRSTGPTSFLLRRVKPLEAIVGPLGAELRGKPRSALSAVFDSPLGADPTASIRLLANRIEPALRAAGWDPGTITLEDAENLVSRVRYLLALTCLQLSPLSSRCASKAEAPRDLDALLDAVVKEAVKRELALWGQPGDELQ